MSNFDDNVNRMLADGEITEEDADEIRNFASFLAAIPRRHKDMTPEERKQFRDAWREHYPEDYALAVAEQKWRKENNQ